MRAVILFLLPVLLSGSYASDENLRRVLPASERIERMEIRLDDAAADRVGRRVGRRVPPGTTEEIAVGHDAAGRVTGYALVLEEIGKHRPITFLVGISPDLVVRRVEVLAYRENWGGQIQSRRFLDQFEGKNEADPLQPNRDLHGISGASLSVRASGVVVRRALALAAEAVRPAR